MKLSFSTRGWGELSWEEWVNTAISMDFSGIEIYNLHKYPHLQEKNAPLHPHSSAATARYLRDKRLHRSR